MKISSLILIYLTVISCANEAAVENGKIDREDLVTRHNVHISKIDTLNSLTVGNGTFAFTVDATGLQTFPEYYRDGMPLGTQAEWGWDTSKNKDSLEFRETLKNYKQYGRDISYSVQKKDKRSRKAVEYFRANPHRLQLGNIGFELFDGAGQSIDPNDIKAIKQKLNLWKGEIHSIFLVGDIPVKVWTYVNQKDDVVSVRIESELIRKKQLKIRIRIPEPTAGWTDLGTDWIESENHDSKLSQESTNTAIITRTLDSLEYRIGVRWNEEGAIIKKEDNYYLLVPSQKSSEFEFSAEFSNSENISINEIPTFLETKTSSIEGWKKFWESGGAIDFSGSKDPRAEELERRVVLSQYLTKLQNTGKLPPQETGLTYNSWYGKFHLEMHWWHGVHFALWNRPEFLEKTLPWYQGVMDKAQALAKRQGFDGARWQKMTGPFGNEAPSSVGAFLIWQQPHPIYFAELIYNEKHSKETLLKYKDLVFNTADFMASFVHYDPEQDRYKLGPGVIPAQERFKAVETYNPTFELAYWKWGISTALEWKKRLGEELPEKWINVSQKLSKLPIQDNLYLAAESATDSYTNPEYRTDHPSVLGTYGVLPETSLVDKKIMRKTFDWIWDNWSWEKTWGWDFPMTAMTAARLGMPEKAIEALLMDVRTNTYLKNGHNYQEDRLPVYLPGNGGLLTAIAMMAAGWEGSEKKNPGFPDDGLWNVRWEGLRPMF